MMREKLKVYRDINATQHLLSNWQKGKQKLLLQILVILLYNIYLYLDNEDKNFSRKVS